MQYIRSVHIRGARLPGQLNFSRWGLILWVVFMGLTSCHYSGAQKYQVVFSLVENLCTLALSVCFQVISKCVIALRGC